VANDLVLLSGRGEGDAEGGSRGYSRGASAGGNFDQSHGHHEEPAHATGIQDEDIPF